MKAVIALLMLAVALIVAPDCRAVAVPVEADTATLGRFEAYTKPSVAPLILPASLFAAGAAASASHWWRHHVDASVTRAMGSHRSWDIAEGAEWLPYAMMLGSDYIGGRARIGIVDRALLAATSFVILEAVTQPLKRIVGRQRPDGSDLHSFPSGHTATAFAGAELTRMAYGNLWGAGAYAIAAGVAAMRIAGRHHYLSDVIAGAGTGILSARLAAWLLPWERWVLHLGGEGRGLTAAPSDGVSASIVPAVSTVSFGATLLVSF